GTGKEQTITITGSTSLDQGEIDRMVGEAEANAAEDKKRREEVEVRNGADTLVYQVDRQLKDLGDKVPQHEKARVEQLLNDLRAALQENAPVDKIRGLKSDLEQAAHSLSQAAYGQEAGCSGGTCGGGAGNAGAGSAGRVKPDDDVVDAEYEEK
ncbi:MAG: Hsp70 family protein, partial [Firmicutes bacterium]|nr:Hsp70 family protein [Bacillota bacterium]